MSKRRTTPQRMTRRERQQIRAEAAHRSRVRWGWIGASVAAVAVLGALLGLHFAAASKPVPAPAVPVAAVGQPAPNGRLTTASGAVTTVSALQGKPTLLWFVTTWCSSCQAGTQAMAQDLPNLRADGVRVVEVENYRDLGQAGPSIQAFASALAGKAANAGDWTFGTASKQLTQEYNPGAELDIYYLLNSSGRVVYVNSAPASTMSQLLQAAKSVA